MQEILLATEQGKMQSILHFKVLLVNDELLDLLAVHNGTEVEDTQVLPFSKQIQPPLSVRNYLCVKKGHAFLSKMFTLIKLHGSLKEGR